MGQALPGPFFDAMNNFLQSLGDSPEQSVVHFAADFQQYAKTVSIEEVISKEILRCKATSRHTAAMRSPNALNIHSGSWFCIDVIAYGDAQLIDPLTTHPSDTVFYFLSPANLSSFKLEGYDNGVFNPAARAVFQGNRPISAGDVVAVQSSEEIISLTSSEPILTLALSNRRLNRFAWDFELSQGIALRHYNNYSLSTMMELMAKMLGCYAGESSIPCLQAMLEHDSDTIKWQAAYAIMRIDPRSGIEAFKQLAASTNPSVSRSAALTLEKLQHATV